MTEAELMPEIYTPARNDNGLYYDNDSFKIPRHGMKCGCSSSTKFVKRANFKSHWKTKGHMSWLQKLTEDEKNTFKDNVQHVEVNKQQIKQLTEQSIIIARQSTAYMDLNDNYKKVTKQNEELLNDNYKFRIILQKIHSHGHCNNQEVEEAIGLD